MLHRFELRKIQGRYVYLQYITVSRINLNLSMQDLLILCSRALNVTNTQNMSFIFTWVSSTEVTKCAIQVFIIKVNNSVVFVDLVVFHDKI